MIGQMFGFLCAKFTYRKPQEQAGFADTRVSDQQEFEEVIAVFRKYSKNTNMNRNID